MYSEPTKDPLPWKWVTEALVKIVEAPEELLAADARVGASREFLPLGQGEEPSDTSTASRKKRRVSESSSLDMLKAMLLKEHPGLLTSLKEHCGLQSDPNKAIKCKTIFQDPEVLGPSGCTSGCSAGSKMDILKSNMQSKNDANFAKLRNGQSDCVVTCVENETHQMLKITSQIESQKNSPHVLSGGNGIEISGEETSCRLQNSLNANVADSSQRTNTVCADGMYIQALGSSSIGKQEHNISKQKISTQDVQLVLGITSISGNSTAQLQGDSSKSTQQMLKQKVAAVEAEELRILNIDRLTTDSNCQRTHQSCTLISQAETPGILNNPQGANLEDTDQAIRKEVDFFSSRGTGYQELQQKSKPYDTKKEAVGSNVQLPEQQSSTPALDANSTILQEDSPRKEKSMPAQNATDVNKKYYPTSYFLEAGDDHAQLRVDTSISGHDLPVNGDSRDMNPECLIINRMTNGNLTSSDLQIVGNIFANEKQKLLSCQVDMNVKRDICMKCNKGDGLLHCQCGITIHENCLGLPIEVKNLGTFICPVCLHFSAVIALGKALNTVSETNAAFRAFLSFGFLSGQEQPASNGLIGGRECEASHQHVESHAAVEKINSPQLENPSRPLHVTGHQICENFANNDPQITKEHETHKDVISVNGCKDKELAPEMSEERPQDSLADSRVLQKGSLTNDHMTTQHLEAESVHDLDNDGITHKKNKHVDIDICTTNQTTRMEHLENHQEEASTYSDDAKKKVVEKQLAKENKGRVRSDGICMGSSSRSNVQTRVKSQSHNKLVPDKLYSTLGRRNKLAWSDEEVQALEELVISFASGNSKNMPWRKILEAGGSRFHKTRQPVDLKDKWRNIKKTEKG